MNSLNIPSVGPEPSSSGVAQQDNSDVAPIAFRVAAGILYVGSFLALAGMLFGSSPNLIALLIDVGLAFGLMRLSSGARSFTLFRAYAGAILWPILLFVQTEFVVALIMTVIQLAYCGSLILVLQGPTRNWKLYLSAAIFVVFVFCGLSYFYLFALVSLLAR